MSKGILINAYGGPEVLTYGDVPVAEPQAEQVPIRQTAIGVNFIDFITAQVSILQNYHWFQGARARV